jgi:Rieske Fe-S protein
MELPIIDIQRREFFAKALLGVGVAACSGILAACEPFISKIPVAPTGSQAIFDTIKDDPTGILKTVGNGIVVPLKDANGNSINGAHSIVIMRIGTDAKPEYIALSSRCNHEDCDVVAPAAPGENIVCPCHNSEFSSTDGKLIAGPATASLGKFNSSYDSVTKLLTIYA